MSVDISSDQIDSFALEEVELLLRYTAMCYAAIVSQGNLRRANDTVKDILMDYAARVHIRREQAHEAHEKERSER